MRTILDRLNFIIFNSISNKCSIKDQKLKMAAHNAGNFKYEAFRFTMYTNQN